MLLERYNPVFVGENVERPLIHKIGSRQGTRWSFDRAGLFLWLRQRQYTSFTELPDALEDTYVPYENA